NLSGPFSPVREPGANRFQSAAVIDDPASQPSAQTEGPASGFGIDLIPPGVVEDQWAIAAQPGLKIGITQDGWYRLTQADLLAAGFDLSGDSHNLRLFVNSHEVSMNVSRSSGSLTPDDFIEFYGVGIDATTTGTRIYYLINGSLPGARITVA